MYLDLTLTKQKEHSVLVNRHSGTQFQKSSCLHIPHPQHREARQVSLTTPRAGRSAQEMAVGQDSGRWGEPSV